jgi:predicted DNA-binding transcriptional regulator YafY
MRDFTGERRFAIATFMIEVLRRGPESAASSLSERLVLYAVMISTYGPRRLGLLKLAGLLGLPRNTVRRALERLAERGAVVRGADGYRLSAEFLDGSYSAARTEATSHRAGAGAQASANRPGGTWGGGY